MKNYEFIEYKEMSLLQQVLEFNNISKEEFLELQSEKVPYELNNDNLNDIIDKLKSIKKNQEKILICGDYDCDGVCATSIMYYTLTKFGIECGYYIPNRFSEGYGVNINTVRLAKEKGYSNIITVDNGVKAFEALQFCKKNNINIILTDHHSFDENELIYDFFLHPTILDDYYNDVCGAGLAMIISEKLIGETSLVSILAGIATIGDVMKLKKYNRFIVKRCLRLLNQGEGISIQLLINQKKWFSEDLAFQIVPRINAIGRMNEKFNCNNLVKYLISSNKEAMLPIAKYINLINNERKKISNSMYQYIINNVDLNSDFLIIYDKNFHEGINGIVAGKLSNEFNKPVMVLTNKNGILKGSIRSNTIDLTTFFDEIKDNLLSFGGHKEAAGISFDLSYLETLKYFIKNKLKKVDIKNDKIPVLNIKKSRLSVEEIENLNILEPFGNGIEKPLICIEDSVQKGFKFANGKHLKLFSDFLEYIDFNTNIKRIDTYFNNKLKFIGKLNLNDFKNKKTINMIVEDVIK